MTAAYVTSGVVSGTQSQQQLSSSPSTVTTSSIMSPVLSNAVAASSPPSNVALSSSPSQRHHHGHHRHHIQEKEDQYQHPGIPLPLSSSPPCLVGLDSFPSYLSSPTSSSGWVDHNAYYYINPRTQILDKWINVMAAHPNYLDPYLRTHNFIMRGDGPLPYNVRHYIALMAAARHQNVYLVNRQKQEFLAYDGDHRWLRGLDFAPKKLRDLNDLNKFLAHRPWQVTPQHIQRLTRGMEENWSISEVCHAIVILTHFHALSCFVWSSGITGDDEERDVITGSGSSDNAAHGGSSNNPSKATGGASGLSSPTETESEGATSTASISPPLAIKGGEAIGPLGRTGQDSPPLDPHPGSPPSEASVEVLMQKMATISQQHKQLSDDRSPEELQKVFEKVEISMVIPPSTPPDGTSGTSDTTPVNVLKEKDPNVVTSSNTDPPASTDTIPTPSPTLASSPPNSSAISSPPTTTSSNNYSTYNNYSCSPSTGHHYLFGARGLASGLAGEKAPVSSSTTGNDENLREDIARYVIDGDFSYTDFYRRGEASDFTTFRIQDCSWDDHGFSLINQFYNDVGNLLDDKFKITYNMTYYTMGRKTNVDTSMFRRAIWNYIQCIYGIRHDDYDYREVNELLTRDLKTYIKNVCCFPYRVKKEDCDRVMPEFWRSEKIHVNLMISEARMQAALLYALRAVMQYMT